MYARFSVCYLTCRNLQLKVEVVWVIDLADVGINKSGAVNWDENTGVLRIQLKSQSAAVKLKREDLQVVETNIWDAGIYVSRGGPYTFGTTKINNPTIYFSGFASAEKEEEFKNFLSRCKRYGVKKPEEATQ